MVKDTSPRPFGSEKRFPLFPLSGSCSHFWQLVLDVLLGQCNLVCLACNAFLGVAVSSWKLQNFMQNACWDIWSKTPLRGLLVLRKDFNLFPLTHVETYGFGFLFPEKIDNFVRCTSGVQCSPLIPLCSLVPIRFPLWGSCWKLPSLCQRPLCSHSLFPLSGSCSHFWQLVLDVLLGQCNFSVFSLPMRF